MSTSCDASLITGPVFTAHDGDSGFFPNDGTNYGYGWAYNATAEIINAPASVNVLDGTASFAHPDDPDPATLRTIPIIKVTS